MTVLAILEAISKVFVFNAFASVVIYRIVMFINAK